VKKCVKTTECRVTISNAHAKNARKKGNRKQVDRFKIT
jgi:hypothetical protein